MLEIIRINEEHKYHSHKTKYVREEEHKHKAQMYKAFETCDIIKDKSLY